ncbi:MAG: aldo/keto reductase, partial [Spirochaetaceae bacterium]|nr:aldo/keto reductase [Spirochaetaceae bacterium]
LHRDDPGVPVGPIVEALHEHWEAGRVRAYGGSNWTWKRMNEANDYAASHGLHPFTVSSQHFSLAEQVNDPWGGGCVSVAGPNEAEARAWHVSSGIPLFAYASLSGGFFSGRFSRESFESMKAAGKIGEDCLRAYCYPRNFDRQDRAIELAAMKGLSLPQIAISYVVSHAEHGIIDVHALVGAGSPEELETDVAGAELLLSRSEIEWLDLRRDSLD